jgi:toxin ParE1/3/4
MKINWSPLSIERIFEIAKYIAEDKPGASENWIDSIFNSVERLTKFPESGRVVPEIKRQEIREILLGNYRIIYRIENDLISVLTISHGKQLLSKEDLSK